jgi:glycosyltransferase involved in cell wall biosynthesis
VPTLTNASAGLPTTVKDHVSGIVLPKGSPAEAYVEVIQHYLANRDEYNRLCQTTRQRYEAELNYDAVGTKIFQLLKDAAEGK